MYNNLQYASLICFTVMGSSDVNINTLISSWLDWNVIKITASTCLTVLVVYSVTCGYIFFEWRFKRNGYTNIIKLSKQPGDKFAHTVFVPILIIMIWSVINSETQLPVPVSFVPALLLQGAPYVEGSHVHTLISAALQQSRRTEPHLS